MEQVLLSPILKSIKEINFLKKISNIILYSGLLLGVVFVVVWFLMLLFWM